MVANLTKLLIVKQILPVSTKGTVQRRVWRIWILMLGCKGLTDGHLILTSIASLLSSCCDWLILSK